MRKVLLLITVIALVATSAFAAKLPAKQASKEAAMNLNLGRALFEGFEAGVPPAGWTAGVTAPTNTWGTGISPFEGTAEANVPWTADYVQDESLYVDYLVEAGDHLTFYHMGSQYWATNANFTVSINGTMVYDFLTDTNYPAPFEYFQVDIDLAAYVGTTISVDFNYAGTDGADHHLDAVNFGEVIVIVDPDVEFCDMVEPVSGTGLFYGDTCDGVNLIESLACGNYSEAGLEDYYGVLVPAGGSFTATVTNTADGALWVLAECLGVEGVFNCLAYADDTLSGDPEVISYANTSGVDEVVYLVIDSWGGDSCGTYEMDFVGTGGAVANEDMSFGAVKALYR